jgi:hypothetical protein
VSGASRSRWRRRHPRCSRRGEPTAGISPSARRWNSTKLARPACRARRPCDPMAPSPARPRRGFASLSTVEPAARQRGTGDLQVATGEVGGRPGVEALVRDEGYGPRVGLPHRRSRWSPPAVTPAPAERAAPAASRAGAVRAPSSAMCGLRAWARPAVTRRSPRPAERHIARSASRFTPPFPAGGMACRATSLGATASAG